MLAGDSLQVVLVGHAGMRRQPEAVAVVVAYMGAALAVGNADVADTIAEDNGAAEEEHSTAADGDK